MRLVFNPTMVPGGEVCCGLAGEPGDYTVTGGVKSPRLAGVWARPRLLHNGSVAGLENLLCLNGNRPLLPQPPAASMGDHGHMMGVFDAHPSTEAGPGGVPQDPLTRLTTPRLSWRVARHPTTRPCGLHACGTTTRTPATRMFRAPLFPSAARVAAH